MAKGKISVKKGIKNLCIIQARVESTRLPSKVLLDLYGKSVLERVLERTSASRLVSKVAVATGIGKENLPIVRICATKGIPVFCGSEEDVLDRFYQLAKLFNPENVVRITADCPLIDPAVIDLVIKNHMRSGADYTSNNAPPTFPDGEDVEIFTFSALRDAWKNASLMSEREHVTPYIRKHKFDLHCVQNKIDLSSKRWTLDDPEDYKFIKAVYQAFKGKNMFAMNDVLRLLAKNPKMEKINAGISRNEGYKKSLREDKVVKIGD